MEFSIDTELVIALLTVGSFVFIAWLVTEEIDDIFSARQNRSRLFAAVDEALKKEAD